MGKSNLYVVNSTGSSQTPYLIQVAPGQQWRDNKENRLLEITSIEDGAPHGPHAVCEILLQPKKRVVKIPVKRLLREDIFVMIRNEKRQRVFPAEDVSLD